MFTGAWWCLTSGIVDDQVTSASWGLDPSGSGYLLPHVGGGWGQAHCWVLKNQPFLARVIESGAGWLFWSSFARVHVWSRKGLVCEGVGGVVV